MNSYHNFGRKMSFINQNDESGYNYQRQKEFIYKQKQWIKQIESKYHSKKQSYNNPYKEKITQQKPYVLIQAQDLNNQIQLDKTVKHKNYRQNLNNDNKSQITTKIVYYDKDEQKRTGNYSKIKQNQTNILSISQIKRLQKQSVDQTKIHRITSSNSKNKSRTSGSNQSKLSQKISKKMQNSAASRYSKYINNEPLLNINIDLRRQVIQETMSGQILRNNLNRRRIQRIQKISNNQGLIQKRQIPQNECKTHQRQKQVDERQLNKGKGYQFQRSRSNLSKYCQIQQSKSRVSLGFKKQEFVVNSNIKVLTPRKVSLNNQAKHNKIHKICSSNYKSKEQCQQKKFYSQRKIERNPKYNHHESQKRILQTPKSSYRQNQPKSSYRQNQPKSSYLQIQDIMNFNLQPRQINYKDKKTSFNIRQDYLQEVPFGGQVLTHNPSKKARIKLSIFKK